MNKLFIYTHSKGHIDYYRVNPKCDVYIDAIDIETGDIDKKRVLGYSIHKNLTMYKIYDPKGRFETFWLSDDHSAIVYNTINKMYEKISPVKILENPEIYCFVQKKNFDRVFIPCSEISITYDPDITEGADFVVEDYYTFTTNDGIFVQDTMAVYRPLTKAAIKECKERLWTINNVFSAANAKVQYKAKQAILYGLYKMTETEKGRKLLSEILDEKIDQQVDAKYLSTKIEKLCKEKGWQVLDKIKNIGLSATLKYPETLSILDLEPKLLQLTGDLEKDSKIIEENNKTLEKTFSKAGLIKSGSRGSWGQVRQMISTKGYVSDFWGNIVPIPVRSCYAQGLNQKEFFISCYGARKAILDIAENTAKSGFLTRKMVYSTASCELDLKTEDCNTLTCIGLEINSMDLANALWGRYYYDSIDGEIGTELKCVENPEDIYGKMIYLRSPIFCKNTKICKTCYGKLADIHKSKYIGIIAAQTLGERSTQLVLRTFHTGGVAKGSKGKQEDIITSMSASIESLDKTIELESYQDAVEHTLNLFNLFKEYGNLHLVHFEILTSQRLWAELPDKVVRVRTNLDELEKLEKLDTEGRIVDMGYSLKLYALSAVPSLESWFLGLAFQNARLNFIKGYLYPTKTKNILEKIILGEI